MNLAKDISFLYCPFLILDIEVILVSLNDLGVRFFVYIFWTSVFRIGAVYSLTILEATL